MAPYTLVFSAVTALICLADGQITPCTPPNGGSGTCKSIFQCPSMLEILNKSNRTPQEIDLLKKSQCGFQDKAPKVCCPLPCYTPEGQPGQCVSIYTCPHLAQMLRPPVSDANMKYVQNSKCNGAAQYSVCCGTPRDTSITLHDCVSQLSAFPLERSTECCGLDSRVGNKITGGNATTVDQYPWLVIIEYVQRSKLSLLCGGALISARYVLTAGHCVTGEVLNSGTPKNVRLGEYNIINEGRDCAPVEAGAMDCTTGAITIPIEKILPHPRYNSGSKQSPNDIALIRLAQMAPFTDFIRPICLPSVDLTARPPANFTLYAAGWGAVSTKEPYSAVKLHVDLPFVRKEDCEVAYTSGGRNLRLTSGQVCAGGVPGKDSCRGDSGGPLMYDDGNNVYDIIGVVSFGPTPCGLPNVPGVYTKVYEYNSWIRSNMEP